MQIELEREKERIANDGQPAAAKPDVAPTTEKPTQITTDDEIPTDEDS